VPLPSNLPFRSYLQYSPRGTAHASAYSKAVTLAIKRDGYVSTADEGTKPAIDYVVRRLVGDLPNHQCLRECFGSAGGALIPPERATLVPVPRSAPLVAGGLWPAMRICAALVTHGLAAESLPLIVRARAVQKSAFAAPGQRPTPQDHYDSLALDPTRPLPQTRKLFVIVDDVVTRGATLLACYARLREAYPADPILCFAMVRTMSGADVATVRDPVEGVITYHGGSPHRQP
jgi:hypothetical protein